MESGRKQTGVIEISDDEDETYVSSTKSTIIDSEDVFKSRQKEERQKFGQMLGDKCLATDIVLDDIVTEVHTRK